MEKTIKIAMFVLLGLICSAMFASVITGVSQAIASESVEIMEEFRSSKTELKRVQSELLEAETKVEYWREKREANIKKQNDYINAGLEELDKNDESRAESTIEESPEKGAFDISKLAYAVAMAETKDCTTGMGVTKLNCFGIMEWPNGVRQGKTYNTKDEAYGDFRRIWESFYGGYPTYQQAVKWTGNDHPDNWLKIVSFYYNK